MLYAIQQATSLMKYRAKLQATQPETMPAAKEQAHLDSPALASRISGFEQEFGINPGTDIDAEIDWTLRKADEEVELRHVNDLAAPPPGMRIGSPQDRIYRQEVYQSLSMQMNSVEHQLRDYYEEKRQQVEKLRKEMFSATPVPERRANTA